jgi:protein-disulfide isomerase
MSKALALGITGAALSVAMLAAGFVAGNRAAPVAAGASAGTAASTVSRGEVELIVRDYLLRNPEILGDMQAELEDRQREAQRVALLDAIGNSSDAIFNAAHDGVVGNPEGSTTVVEFFDYNCGFCKRAHEDMTAMVAADPRPGFAGRACRVDGIPGAGAGKIRRVPRRRADGRRPRDGS